MSSPTSSQSCRTGTTPTLNGSAEDPRRSNTAKSEVPSTPTLLSTTGCKSDTLYDPASKERECKYLGKRFNFKVVLSTFACSLNVAYIGYVNKVASPDRVNYAHGIPYNFFLLLAFLAIACHGASSVFASRAAALCSDPDFMDDHHDKVESPKNTESPGRKDDVPRHAVKDFKNILSLCEHLNSDGIFLSVLAIFGLSFFVFENYAYPGIFCGLSLLVLVLILRGEYRKVSRLYKSWRIFRAAVKGWLGKRVQHGSMP